MNNALFTVIAQNCCLLNIECLAKLFPRYNRTCSQDLIPPLAYLQLEWMWNIQEQAQRKQPFQRWLDTVVGRWGPYSVASLGGHKHANIGNYKTWSTSGMVALLTSLAAWLGQKQGNQSVFSCLFLPTQTPVTALRFTRMTNLCTVYKIGTANV